MNHKIKSSEISLIQNNYPSIENTHTFESQFCFIEDKTIKKENLEYPVNTIKEAKLTDENVKFSTQINPNTNNIQFADNSILIRDNVSQNEQLLLDPFVIDSQQNLLKIQDQLKISKNILLIDSYKKFEKLDKYRNLMKKHSFKDSGPENYNQKLIQDFELLNRIKQEANQTENENVSEYYFLKIQSYRFLVLILAIGSGILYHDLKTYGKSYSIDLNILQVAINFVIVIVTISNFLFIITSFFRYQTILDYKKSSKELLKEDTLISSNLWKNLLIELILCIIHPNIVTHELSFTSSKTWNIREVVYDINDFLTLMMMSRTYTILRFFITISRYYNIRAIRVSKMLGDKLSKLTTLRCLIINDPFKLLTIVTSVIVFTISFSIRVIEGPLILIDNDGLDLSIPSNCIWLTLITMTTVGYGDYYPKTNVGRAICVIASFIGSVTISFIIVALTNSLNFSDYEFKAFQHFEKDLIKDEIEKAAGALFHSVYKYKKAKRFYLKSIKSGSSKKNIVKIREELKSLLYENIKRNRRYKNILHHFRTHYEPLTEYICIKEKIDSLKRKTNESKDISQFNNNLVKEIHELTEKIKNVKIEEKSMIDSQKDQSLRYNFNLEKHG